MENDGRRGSRPIVMFPYMAQGHLRPFLGLADLIHRSGYAVTLVTTPHNIEKLRRSLPEESPINLVEIPFTPSHYGLPPDAENTDSIPSSMILPLLEASVELKAPFRTILRGLPEKPLCVISDLFFAWAADVSHELGIFHATFSSSGAFGFACFYSLWVNLPHGEADGDEFCLPDFPEAGKLHVNHLSPLLIELAKGNRPNLKFRTENLSKLPNSDAMLFNTVEGMDGPGLGYFQRKFGIPVFPIGPILPARTTSVAIQDQECIQWLDKQPPKSVLYISFGSQSWISSPQTTALANALESTGTNFIWAMRPPIEANMMDDFLPEQWLPDGYLQRIHKNQTGLILNKWAPQLEILAHRSVSAFMSHCGWNSILESLVHDVSLICWPLGADQFYNSKHLVEELGVAVEVARESGSEVKEETIVEKIEMVMGENREGLKMRKRAEELKGMIEDATRDEEDYKGSSVKAMEEFFVAAKSAACF